MWVFALDSRAIVAVNDAALVHYGLTREALLADTLDSLHPPEDRPRLHAAVERSRQRTGREAEAVGLWKHVRPDGRALLVDITWIAVDLDGCPGRLAMMVDVTEQRRLESERRAALAEALQSREELDRALRRVDDGLVALDRHWRFTYLNPRAAQMIGHADPNALIGTSVWDAFPEAMNQPWHEACSRALTTQRPVVLENWFEPWNRWFENRIFPDGDGLSIYFSDITERRRAQEALRDSERDFRLLAERMPGIVYRAKLGPAPATEYVSPRIQELGFEPAQWLSDPNLLWASIHPEDRERVREEVGRALEGPSDALHFEYRMLAANGDWRYVSDHAQIVRTANGAPAFLLGVNLDVTERKRTEVALREASDFRRELVEQLADGVLVLGGDLTVIDANPSACLLLGRSRQELSRTTLDALLNDADRHVRPDGSDMPVEVSARRLDHGRHLLVLRDISERVAAERTQQHYREELAGLTQKLLSQEQETTRRLAQALHDTLGQTLAAARFHLDALLAAGAVAEVSQGAARHVASLLEDAGAQARRALADLRPPGLEERGLRAALEHEVEQRQREHGNTLLHLEVDPRVRQQRWPHAVEYGGFMVVREALANVRLHADAESAVVRLAGDAESLELEVSDDGVGIPTDVRQGRPGHLGLVGMRERAIAIGASLLIDETPGGGTRVRLAWHR
jgi:PAS domain S-box-containing protein